MAGSTGTSRATSTSRGSGGSFASRSNYGRLVSTFSPEPAPTANAGPNGDVWVPPSDRPPVSDAPPFTAEGVFNKAGLLGLLAVAVGAVAYAANPPSGLVVVAILAWASGSGAPSGPAWPRSWPPSTPSWKAGPSGRSPGITRIAASTP